MGNIVIYQLPSEAHSYLRTVLPETRNVYYVKYLIDKIGLFNVAKGKAVEWQLTNSSGGLTLWDILRQGRNLILSTISAPVGGLVRFNMRSKRAVIFTPNPAIMSLWSYSIQQDENRRIWSTATSKFSPFVPKARPQDNPALARCTLYRNYGTAEYWVLPRALSYPEQLKYDKRGRIWFSMNLISGAGSHQFGVFDPATNIATGYTINGIGTSGISDIAVDAPSTTVWLTHRSPDAVYRFDWKTNKAIVYENPSVNGLGLNDLDAKKIPVFLSSDGHVNALDADRKTGALSVSHSEYKLTPQKTELPNHKLAVSESSNSVSKTSKIEPETYAGPFIRWPVPAIIGNPSPADIKTAGDKVFFTEGGDTLLCVLTS